MNAIGPVALLGIACAKYCCIGLPPHKKKVGIDVYRYRLCIPKLVVPNQIAQAFCFMLMQDAYNKPDETILLWHHFYYFFDRCLVANLALYEINTR